MPLSRKKDQDPSKKNNLLLFEGLIALVYFVNGIYHFPSLASIFELALANLFLIIIVLSNR